MTSLSDTQSINSDYCADKIDKFISLSQQITDIINNPSSYVNQPIQSNYPNEYKSGLLFVTQILNFSTSVDSENKFTQQSLKILTNILKSIIPSDVVIDYSDLEAYFTNYIKTKNNPVCNKYIRNLDIMTKYSDDAQSIKSSDFFGAFNCKSCNHFESNHIICKKYISGDNYDCMTCGIDSSKHVTCSNYTGIDGDCDVCGFDLFHHVMIAEDKKTPDCRNYQKHPETSERCKNCIFNETHHKLKEQIHNLNKKNKDKVTDLFFTLTSKYICMPDTLKLKYYDNYKNLCEMIYIMKM